MNYAKYGSNSSFTNVLTDNELKKTSSEELLTLIKKLIKHSHKIYYYGPENINRVSVIIKEIHKHNSNLLLQKKKVFKEKNIYDTVVYFVDYNIQQTEVIVLSKGTKFNISQQPLIKLHNEYFSEGMSSIIFQDIRESKSLAYSVHASYSSPENIYDSHYFLCYLNTQNSKLSEALSSIYKLIDNMPSFEKNLENSKESIKQKLRTDRLTGFSAIKYYEKLNKLNVDYDLRKDIYKYIDYLDISHLQKFHKLNIGNKNRSILVLGSYKKIDKSIFNQYGKIEYLSLNEIFGY